MAINFPNDPAVNDTITVDANTWVWNGVSWAVQPITSPTFADVSATGVLASYVEAVGVGSKIRFYFNNVANFPNAATWEGSLAYAHDVKRVYISIGSEWREIVLYTPPSESPTVLEIDVESSGTSTFANALISGGAINGTSIGSVTPSTAAFTTVTAINAPVLGNELTNKSYVDRRINLAIALSG